MGILYPMAQRQCAKLQQKRTNLEEFYGREEGIDPGSNHLGRSSEVGPAGPVRMTADTLDLLTSSCATVPSTLLANSGAP